MYTIAVIPGDGIGKEVIREGMRVLDAAGKRFGFQISWQTFPWGCDYYVETGKMMPSDGLDRLRRFDAIFLGAVGTPGVPDHVSLWGLLIPIRRDFRLYVNLRPVKLLMGITSPLRERDAGDIDFYVVREDNEGEYSNIGGRIYAGTEEEITVQESVFTRKGVERIQRFDYELAQKRERKHLTSATKSNGIVYTMPYWDEIFSELSSSYPEIKTDQFHMDALCAKVVLDILGFVVSSVLCLTILMLILDLERLTPKRFLSAIAIYSVMVVAFWLIFHKFLLVPLPEGYPM